jgi:DNA processing protein
LKQAQRRFVTNIGLQVKARERLEAYYKSDVGNPWGTMEETRAENRVVSMQKGERLMSSRTLLCLALVRVSFLKPRERILLADLVEGVDDFLKLGKKDLEALIGRKVRAPSFLPSEFVKKAQTDELYLTKRNILCTLYSGREYPALLKEIYDPPLVLFYRGVLPEPAFSAAVVGTRKPTGKALKAAYRLGFELAEQGVCVISGLAIGIDRAAHRGCIEGNGCACAVLGSGIEAVYPQTSRTLAEKILEKGGALVSEYPPGTASSRVLPMRLSSSKRRRNPERL